MSIFYTDIIKIVDVKTDKYGVKVQTESPNIKARVEDFNGLIRDENGQEVKGKFIIYIKKNQSVKYGSKIKIVIKGGQAYNQPDKLFEIKSLPLIHGFKAHHKEIYI